MFKKLYNDIFFELSNLDLLKFAIKLFQNVFKIEISA